MLVETTKTGRVKVRRFTRGRRPFFDGLDVLEALAAGESVAALASRLGVTHTTIYRTRDRARLVVLTEMAKAGALSANGEGGGL